MRLQGRTAVITGAASGIGRAIALRFASEGATVVVSDVKREPTWDGVSRVPTEEMITGQGGNGVFVLADVSQAADVNNLFDQARSRFGRIDVVVNNAAIVASHSILDTSEEEWDRLMAVNLRGQFLCCKRAV